VYLKCYNFTLSGINECLFKNMREIKSCLKMFVALSVGVGVSGMNVNEARGDIVVAVDPALEDPILVDPMPVSVEEGLALCSDGIDNDGDSLIDCEDLGCSDMAGCLDTDGDTILNGLDCDDDNDGILDTYECSYLAGTFVIDEGGADGNNTGTVDFDDGSSATWSISTTGTDGFFVKESGVNEGVYFRYDGATAWDLTSTFSVPNADVEGISIILYGNTNTDRGFHSAFDTYTISWVGGEGNATVIDPDNEIVEGNGYSLTNGGSFNQTHTHDQTVGNFGAIANRDLNWYVVMPPGATEFTITAVGGSATEGFRFVAAKPCDTDNDGTIDSLDTDADNDGSPDAIEGDGDVGYDSLDENNFITGDVSPCGLPVIADPTGGGTGQGVGSSNEDTVFPEDSESLCSDGLDNNNDGSIDCEDLGCMGFEICADTDGDTILDTEDVDDDNDGILDSNERGDCGNIEDTSLEGHNANASSGYNTYASSFDASSNWFDVEGSTGYIQSGNNPSQTTNPLDASDGEWYIGFHSEMSNGGHQEVFGTELAIPFQTGNHYTFAFDAYQMNLTIGGFANPGRIHLLVVHT